MGGRFGGRGLLLVNNHLIIVIQRVLFIFGLFIVFSRAGGPFSFSSGYTHLNEHKWHRKYQRIKNNFGTIPQADSQAAVANFRRNINHTINHRNYDQYETD